MNKIDILKELELLKKEVNINDVIIISGASLVLQGILDTTNDIDLSCTIDTYKKIQWNKKIGAFGIETKYNNMFDISYNLYYPDDIVLINGYKCMTIKKCLEIKKQLNREKDKEIIKRIEKYLKKSL